jgi:hypothetical protein
MRGLYGLKGVRPWRARLSTGLQPIGAPRRGTRAKGAVIRDASAAGTMEQVADMYDSWPSEPPGEMRGLSTLPRLRSLLPRRPMRCDRPSPFADQSRHPHPIFLKCMAAAGAKELRLD